MNEKKLTNILSMVEKPGRYLGIEINSVHKEWEKTDVKILLSYPDLYELGMSNQGLEILYNIVNERNDSLAERVYAPGLDLEKILRREKVPLFSLESKHPIEDFDIIGFTLQYELSFTNILNILDIGNIPVHVSDRDEKHPLIIAGGPCSCNPEPMADFIDLFVVGDGEEAIVNIIETYRRSRSIGRDKLLMKLAGIDGVYVPSLYSARYNANGAIRDIKPVTKDIPDAVSKATVDISKNNYQAKPLVPLINTVHNRLTLEIQRGCSNNCAFCQARTYYYPLRLKDKKELIDAAEKGLKNTGFDEISLSSLSSVDYPHIEWLVSELIQKYRDKRISVSLSSLRPDRFSLELVNRIRQTRKTGLTFALESGSVRLRGVLNKSIDEDRMLSAISDACKEGWKLIKLYFMIGLPTEQDEDVQTIVDVVNKIKRINNRLNLNITISHFVPKPHTPFQWVGQENIGSLKKKAGFLSRNLRGKVKVHNVESSLLEAVFARGDRRLGRVIEEAWRQGCRFDQWREHFRFDLWKKAFSAQNISMEFYAARIRDAGEILPWEHIDCGISKATFLKEYRKINGSNTEG